MTLFKPRLFDERSTHLGEGVLWHPEREQLFWFDILENKLLSRDGDTPLEWTFHENVSAAGWTGQDTLLIASETRLFEFNLATGSETFVAHLEPHDPGSRSNDGRADPLGGFWIGMMAKRGQSRPGAIYRYYKGELRMILAPITVANAICFTPDGTEAYFSSTRDGKIYRTALDNDGWPVGDPVLLVHEQGYLIDGMVCAANGTLWNTQYKAGRVAVYSPQGTLLETHAIPGKHTTCPGFGGPDLKTLFVSTARQDLSAQECAANPAHGQTFALETQTTGQKEYRVLL